MYRGLAQAEDVTASASGFCSPGRTETTRATPWGLFVAAFVVAVILLGSRGSRTSTPRSFPMRARPTSPPSASVTATRCGCSGRHSSRGGARRGGPRTGSSSGAACWPRWSRFRSRAAGSASRRCAVRRSCTRLWYSGCRCFTSARARRWAAGVQRFFAMAGFAFGRGAARARRRRGPVGTCGAAVGVGDLGSARRGGARSNRRRYARCPLNFSSRSIWATRRASKAASLTHSSRQVTQAPRGGENPCV